MTEQLRVEVNLDGLNALTGARAQLRHDTRRMLQALDGYWLHCDGLPKGKCPRSRSTAEDWWGRFEKYRKLVEVQL